MRSGSGIGCIIGWDDASCLAFAWNPAENLQRSIKTKFCKSLPFHCTIHSLIWRFCLKIGFWERTSSTLLIALSGKGRVLLRVLLVWELLQYYERAKRSQWTTCVWCISSCFSSCHFRGRKGQSYNEAENRQMVMKVNTNEKLEG